MEIFAFYNLENLFYPSPEYQHLSPKKWSEERYRKKLNRIAEVFDLIQKKHNATPTLIGLCEVQGSQVLEDLVQLPTLSDYGFIHSKSLDDRKMDTALLYHKEKIQILEHRDYHFQNTRNILYNKLIFKQKTLHIYTLHLPSKRNLDENKNLRNEILSKLKKNILENLQNSEEYIVILGDFNTNPNDPNILEITDLKENYKLYNPFSELYGKHQFSTFHQNKGLLFDQIIISENFLKKEVSELKFDNAEIFTSDLIKKHGKPFRTFSGSRYLGGYSDHYPVMIRFL